MGEIATCMADQRARDDPADLLPSGPCGGEIVSAGGVRPAFYGIRGLTDGETSSVAELLLGDHGSGAKRNHGCWSRTHRSGRQNQGR